MYINNILLMALIMVLSACTPAVQSDRPATTGDSAPAGTALMTESERNDYRNAITALNNNKLDLAESILKEMLKNRKDLAGPWTNLGLVHLKKNNIPQATKALESALQLNPKQPYALNLMGVIEYNQGNVQKAAGYYEAALLNKPDYANAHYNLALLYDIFYQDIPKAVEHYQQYMELTKHQDKETEVWLQQLASSLKPE
jgi:tetratricopeptide (TPR) repeat protein